MLALPTALNWLIGIAAVGLALYILAVVAIAIFAAILIWKDR